jgi:hypothetical protein
VEALSVAKDAMRYAIFSIFCFSAIFRTFSEKKYRLMRLPKPFAFQQKKGD